GVLLPDQPHGFVAKQRRRVTFITANLIIAMPVEAPVALVSEVIKRAVIMSILVQKSALRRQIGSLKMPQVPLAANGREVTRLLQRLRQRPLLQRQSILGPRPHDANLQAVPHRVAPRHQSCPRWRTDGLHIERFEPSTSSRKLVDVRRFDLAAMKADVGKT